MRFVWLLIILAVIAGVGYVAIFKWDWVKERFSEGKRTVEGYKAAKTPSEAMEQFVKAVNNRDYETAAKYCTGQYGEYLAKAHTAAAAVGGDVDRVWNLMHDKGLHTDKNEALLLRVDPFPPKFRVAEVKADPKNDKRAFGTFHADLGSALATTDVSSELRGMDPKIMNSVLLPPSFYMGPQGVEIVQEGEGEAKQWKLKVPLPDVQRDAINHFINNYRTYVTALDTVINELRNGRYGSKRDFERDLIKQLQESK